MAQSGTEPDDKLRLGNDKTVAKMLDKFGSNFPAQEKVIYSEKLLKINKRGKEQPRVLLITDKALYNLMPNDYSKCRRRVDLETIVSATFSTTSDELTVHIPDEYDYRFKSPNKSRICDILSKVYSDKFKNLQQLKVTSIDQSSLLSVTVTKDVARLQTREQRLKRYKELLEQQAAEDSGDEADESLQTSQLIDSSEKVTPASFQFLKVIGRGSFGKVMQVRKRDSKEIFAMKILKKKALIARNQVEHTKAERQILQSLQHPFLMKLRFAFQTEAKLYFVLDYYRGGELFFHLKKKRRFSEEQARFFVAQVGLALGHLHSLGIIYRDLKPENVLLDDHGFVCLTDFGLSKEVGVGSKSELAHTFCGTPEYLAPEIVVNKGHNKAVDWWSLGVLCYELSVGIPPFYSQNVNEMYRKIQEAPLLFPSSLSKSCKALVTQLLERNPKKRLGSGTDDVKEIQRQPYFRVMDWEKLYNRTMEPPYKPSVKSLDDTSNFDKQFTNEPVVDSYVPTNALKSSDADLDQFGDFSWAHNEQSLNHDDDSD